MAEPERGPEPEPAAPTSGRSIVGAKAGKLPIWVWVALASVGVALGIAVIKRNGTGSTAAATTASPSNLPPAVGLSGGYGQSYSGGLDGGNQYIPAPPTPVTPTPTTTDPTLNLTEGSLYRVAGQQAVYQYQGGQLTWLTAPQFAALGNPWSTVNELPEWAPGSPSWQLNPNQPSYNPNNGAPQPAAGTLASTGGGMAAILGPNGQPVTIPGNQPNGMR